MSSNQLKDIIGECLTAFKNISQEDWKSKTSPTKWSKQEILGHLIDSALNNHRRFVVSQYEQNNKIVYDQENWVSINDYQNAEINHLITLWAILNIQITRIIENLGDSKLENTCDTGKEEVNLNSLSFLIKDYIDHLNHHLKDIL